MKPCVALVILSVVGLILIGGSSAAAGSTTVRFGAPRYVDQNLAGGEPEVFADTMHGRLIYTAHEGTTHLYRDGLLSSPWGNFDFVANYCNQVNVWTSADGGANWYRDRYLGSTCPTSPAINTGFSDPDLTQDAGGRVYNTGINLVNDALFSSADGGVTWNKGTADCHDGDRPWLAGGHSNQVFLATDTLEGDRSGHEVFVSNDGGQTCSTNGIPDNGSLADGGSWTGFGKLYYDRLTGGLVEPAIFDHGNGSFGVGISTRAPGKSFTPREAVHGTSMYAHWPAIAIDGAGTIYLTWDTNNRKAGTSGGCDGAPNPAANSIMLVSTKDFGKTWSHPYTVAHPGTRVFWPWITAGDAGKVSVVWYQTEPQDGLPDLDCQTGHIHVKEATLLGAAGTSPRKYVADAAGRPVHIGWVCQGGTTCVATGQDRRLGDYFTNTLDARGCVLIATGDTRLADPTTGGPYPTARPLFLRQNGGPALRGSRGCG